MNFRFQLLVTKFNFLITFYFMKALIKRLIKILLFLFTAFILIILSALVFTIIRIRTNPNTLSQHHDLNENINYSKNIQTNKNIEFLQKKIT